MRKTLALLALAALVPLAPARAAVTEPAGEYCWYDAGILYSGALTILDEDDPATVRTATVTCSVQVDGAAHAAADEVSVTSAPTPGVVALPPTAVPFVPPDFDPWWICTRIDFVGGPTLYLHDPENRNIEDSWRQSPSALCHHTLETSDARPDDFPGPLVFSTFDAAAGDACAAVDCGVAGTAAVSFVRAAGGAVVRTVPAGWACTDVHTGLPAGVGATLAVPDPGVSCTPQAAVTCERVNATGALAPTGFGRVYVTSACTGVEATRMLSVVTGPVRPVNSVWLGGAPPWRCTAREDLAAEPAYLAQCGLGYF